MIWISSVSTDTIRHTTYFYTYIQCVFALIRVYRGKDESVEDACWPSVLRIMMRYCVAPATPVQPSLTVLPRDSTTLRLDTFPTGCSSGTSQRTCDWMRNLQTSNIATTRLKLATSGGSGDGSGHLSAFIQGVEGDDVFCAWLKTC